MSDWIGLAASIATLILSVFCALLVLRQQRRLATVQTQLDRHDTEIHGLQGAHSQLLVRSLNSPKPRKARKSSSPSADMSERNMTTSIAPKQAEKKEAAVSALHVVAPKTSPE